MIGVIIFSRDRACQLDLLLRSLDEYGSGLLGPVNVIYRATTAEHEQGYQRLINDHLEVRLVANDGQNFVRCVADALSDVTPPYSADLACFLTDDSVFYRRPTFGSIVVGEAICHSFRLGLNTTWCYPHARPQQIPAVHSKVGERIMWDWEGADGDFGYPGSLDGHVFRASHLRRMLMAAPEHANPNQLEDYFNRWCHMQLAVNYPFMTAERTSSLVGIPANRVNETHPNRNGEHFYVSPGELLKRYLDGERLVIPPAVEVRAAHQEIPLVFA